MRCQKFFSKLILLSFVPAICAQAGDRPRVQILNTRDVTELLPNNQTCYGTFQVTSRIQNSFLFGPISIQVQLEK